MRERIKEVLENVECDLDHHQASVATSVNIYTKNNDYSFLGHLLAYIMILYWLLLWIPLIIVSILLVIARGKRL